MSEVCGAVKLATTFLIEQRIKLITGPANSGLSLAAAVSFHSMLLDQPIELLHLTKNYKVTIWDQRDNNGWFISRKQESFKEKRLAMIDDDCVNGDSILWSIGKINHFFGEPLPSIIILLTHGITGEMESLKEKVFTQPIEIYSLWGTSFQKEKVPFTVIPQLED
jgi:orotate phosphoribosyltransferase-like protein